MTGVVMGVGVVLVGVVEREWVGYGRRVARRARERKEVLILRVRICLNIS